MAPYNFIKSQAQFQISISNFKGRLQLKPVPFLYQYILVSYITIHNEFPEEVSAS